MEECDESSIPVGEEYGWLEEESEAMLEKDQAPIEFVGDNILERGTEADGTSKGRPCSTVFLDELLRNLCGWNVHLALSIHTYRNQDRDLDDDAKAVVEHIFEAMEECTRLRLHPELFISGEARAHFLAHVAFISEEIMIQLSKISQKMDILLVASKNDTTLLPPEKVRKVGGVYYRIRNPGLQDPEGLHRTKTDRKPWTKWLNNRSQQESKIQQRIPDTGHKMLRRLHHMYKSIEVNFEKTGRRLKKTENSSYLARATGEDYSTLITPPTHPHISVPLHFHTNISNQVDNWGVAKIEAITVACTCFQQRALVPARTGIMCLEVHRN